MGDLSIFLPRCLLQFSQARLRINNIICLFLIIAFTKLPLVSSASPLPTPAISSDEKYSLFQRSEIKSSRLSNFSKWLTVIERHNLQISQFAHFCHLEKLTNCRSLRWIKFLDRYRNVDKSLQINAVNKFVNDSQYVLDSTNWGRSDYWATPIEFFENGGDCEDFAIAKYFSLRFLGFLVEDLRIVVLKDNLLGQQHAVLAVYIDDDIVIMDNQIRSPTSHALIKHYKPHYSINEKFWWLHR